jgi:hypothetical protein
MNTKSIMQEKQKAIQDVLSQLEKEGFKLPSTQSEEKNDQHEELGETPKQVPKKKREKPVGVLLYGEEMMKEIDKSYVPEEESTDEN